MPRRSCRDGKSLRRSNWKSRLVKREADEKRVAKNIYIGATNARRWIILKRQLAYRSDVDFVAYLLDLADPILGKEKLGLKSKGKDDDDKKKNGSDLQKADTEEETTDSTSSQQADISDDGEWKPSGGGPLSDRPLRRSPRKQAKALKLHVRRSARNISKDGKERAVKEKENKIEKPCKILTKEEEKPVVDKLEKVPVVVLHNKVHADITDAKLKVELNRITEEPKQAPIQEEAESKDDAEELEDNEDYENADNEDEAATSKENEALEEMPEELSKDEGEDVTKEQEPEQNNVFGESQDEEEEEEEEEEDDEEKEEEEEEVKQQKSDSVVCEVESPESYNSPKVPEDIHIEVGERVKLKRRKKRRNRGEGEDERLSEEGKKKSEDYVHSGKHKRKKHKHGESHSTKRKHHDIRKAPQDGIPNVSVQPVVISNEKPDDSEKKQRVAIKIKLCCDCNSRHVQDACPLQNPQAFINDSVIFNQWLEAQRTSPSKCLEAASNHRTNCNGESSTDTSGNGEDDEKLGKDLQCSSSDSNGPCGLLPQSTTEQPTQGYDSPQTLDSSHKRSFAEATLPSILRLEVRDAEHGLSVVTQCKVKQYTQFGPLMGEKIKEMDIPDDFNMKDIWEVNTSTERFYLSTMDTNRSNWLRYLRPAPTRDQRNMALVVQGNDLYFVTTSDVEEGKELLYWADDSATNWSKKKMEKTSCGGCNLHFSHPLYYRMHCTVFHDPNFSLTIRKYHCKVCGMAVLGKENIMKHAAEMHDGKGAYQCQYCKKFFLRLNYLEMHRTYGCAANPQRTRPLCDFCGRKFCQPQKLKVHIKRMHSDMADVLREFQCKICLKLLGSRAALQRHMKEVHHKDIIGACTCDRCGKMFQNKSNLKIHMLTHSGVKPFKCIENGCTAAFTTKQCLQFHYKKVHGFAEDSMPSIERCVAYTFDAYSGGIVEDPGRGKVPRFTKGGNRRDSTENTSSLSLDDSSSASSLKADISGTSTEGRSKTDSLPPFVEQEKHLDRQEQELVPSPAPLVTQPLISQPPPTNMLDNYITSYATKVVSKGSKKWMGDVTSAAPKSSEDKLSPESLVDLKSKDVYDFDDKEDDAPDLDARFDQATKVFRRPAAESNASLLVEAALDAAERDMTGKMSATSVITEMKTESLYAESKYLSRLPLTNGHHEDIPGAHELPGSEHDPSETPVNQNHADSYGLPSGHGESSGVLHQDMGDNLSSDDGDVSPIAPDSVRHHDLGSVGGDVAQNLSIGLKESGDKGNIPSDQEDMHHQLQIATSEGIDEGLDMTYKQYEQRHLNSGNLQSAEAAEMMHSPLTHSDMDMGMSRQGMELVAGHPGVDDLSPRQAGQAMDHLSQLPELQEDLRSEFRVLQGPLRSPDTGRSGFVPPLTTESLVSHMNSAESIRLSLMSPQEQGLDMSRSSGYGFSRPELASHPQARYQELHRGMLYDMERPPSQSVDLSMGGRNLVYSPPADISRTPPGYSHTEVLRVAELQRHVAASQSLDLTPARHSMDLSLPRTMHDSNLELGRAMSPMSPPHGQIHSIPSRVVSPHSQLMSPAPQPLLTSRVVTSHHHQLPSRVMTPNPQSRVMSPHPSQMGLTSSRVMSPISPAPNMDPMSRIMPPNTPNHVSDMSRIISPVSNQNLDPSRVMSPPGYQNYPVSPSPYHPPRTSHIASTSPSTYHHYSGYY